MVCQAYNRKKAARAKTGWLVARKYALGASKNNGQAFEKKAKVHRKEFFPGGALDRICSKELGTRYPAVPRKGIKPINEGCR